MLVRFVAGSMFARKGNILGAVMAEVIAVTIMFATLLVLLSAFNGPGITQRLDATDLVLRTDAAEMLDVPADSVPTDIAFRLPADIARRVADVNGVESVVTGTTFYAQLIDKNGQLVTVSEDAEPRGQPWEAAALTPFMLEEGDAPSTGSEIVIDRALAKTGGFTIGDEVLVANNEAPSRYRISGIAALDDVDGLDRQSSVFFSSPTAARLAGTENGEADLVGVFLAPDADVSAMRERIIGAVDADNIDVLVGDDRAKADVSAGSAQLLELGIVLGVMAAFVGFVAIFLLASTFAFSILQRHREIGLQRAIGFTPRQIRNSIAFEAIVIAILGSLIGIGTGYLLAKAFVWYAIRRDYAPEGFAITFEWIVLVGVIVASFLIAQVAVFGAGRRASRIRPIEALRESGAPTRLLGPMRLLIGCLFLGGGVASIVLSSSIPSDAAVAMSLLTTTCMTIGAALLGPILVVPVVAVVGRLLGRTTGTTGELAFTNSRRFPARVASVVSPVVLSLGFATLMFCFNGTLQTATVQITDERMTADLYVLPAGEGFPMSVEPLIRNVDGVESIDAQLLVTTMYWGESGASDVTTLGVDPNALGSTMNLEFKSGGLDQFNEGTVLLSPLGAEQYNASTGDTISVRTENMTTVEMRVAGIYENALGTADMMIARDEVVGTTQDPLLDAVLVNVEDGADRTAVARNIEALAEQGYPLEVISQDEYITGVDQSVADDSWATFLIIGSASLFAGLSVINTLTMSTLERSREFALMRLIGATSRQVVTTIAKEAAIVIVIGVALGWGIGVASTYSVSVGTVGDLTALTVPILPLLGIGLLAALVVFAAFLIPGMLALRPDPISQIGSKE